ncbi:MAG: GNAT family N-acetyltransferase [Clostridium sp.]|uniref:GNAT family N-acetyltransferase n=1 Tax=Clostridium sp. TaxID=1506 RepID=UPI003F2A7A82
MEEIKIVRPKENNINSYWYAFDSIAREGKYFASTRAHPYDETYEFMMETIRSGFPSFLLLKNDEVIGFADARPICKKIGYVGIGIVKEFRGKGFGKKLMNEVIEDSKKYGYERLEIDVRKDNERAVALYIELKFEIRRVLKDALILGENKISVIQMERII